jgi:hypothetical protein
MSDNMIIIRQPIIGEKLSDKMLLPDNMLSNKILHIVKDKYIGNRLNFINPPIGLYITMFPDFPGNYCTLRI